MPYLQQSMISFGVEDYVLPSWSALPTANLEVVKDGTQIGVINIRHKAFHLIGKLEDLCDIYIDNPTVSRKHAILQFKTEQLTPYLYDLGSTHGTRINRKQLPPRVYHPLQPFDTIKFGTSSRMYVLRCIQLEQLNSQKQDQAHNQFTQIINTNHIKISKEQMKDKYLTLLNNDPYYFSQNQPRKLVGRDVQQDIDGVDWGIKDQNQVYAYANQHQFALEPDLLRRLPGLDRQQLDKISQFQTHFNKYKEIESQLNELNNKQKQQYGLQEKNRNKKQKLQKKFIQILEQVQKSQSWVRKNLFGEQQQVLNNQRRQKQIDTFQDDQFYDRTLQSKNHNTNQYSIKPQNVTTVDYWKLTKLLQTKLYRKAQLTSILKQQVQKAPQQEDQNEDQLDAYMKQTQKSLKIQTKSLAIKQIQQLQQQIKAIQSQLSLKQKDIKNLQNKILGITEKQIKTIDEEKQKQKSHQKTQKVLRQLEILRRSKYNLQQQDIQIFKYYEQEAKQQLNQSIKRNYRQEQQSQQKFQKPIAKYPKLQVKRDKLPQQLEQQYIDLTKFKK